MSVGGGTALKTTNGTLGVAGGGRAGSPLKTPEVRGANCSLTVGTLPPWHYGNHSPPVTPLLGALKGHFLGDAQEEGP